MDKKRILIKLLFSLLCSRVHAQTEPELLEDFIELVDNDTSFTTTAVASNERLLRQTLDRQCFIRDRISRPVATYSTSLVVDVAFNLYSFAGIDDPKEQ